MEESYRNFPDEEGTERIFLAHSFSSTPPVTEIFPMRRELKDAGVGCHLVQHARYRNFPDEEGTERIR